MRLKGTGKKGKSRTRTERPIEFKLRVAELVLCEKKSVKKALQLACVEFKLPPTDGMSTAPHSFWGMYKDSINTGIKAKTPAVVAFFEKHPELGEDDEPATEAPEAPEAVAEAEEAIEASDDDESAEDDDDAEGIDEEELASTLDEEDN